MTELQRMKQERELIQICKNCIGEFFERNPIEVSFDYRQCERCVNGCKTHKLEEGGEWDSAPFASTKWGK